MGIEEITLSYFEKHFNAVIKCVEKGQVIKVLDEKNQNEPLVVLLPTKKYQEMQALIDTFQKKLVTPS